MALFQNNKIFSKGSFNPVERIGMNLNKGRIHGDEHLHGVSKHEISKFSDALNEHFKGSPISKRDLNKFLEKQEFRKFRGIFEKGELSGIKHELLDENCDTHQEGHFEK